MPGQGNGSVKDHTDAPRHGQARIPVVGFPGGIGAGGPAWALNDPGFAAAFPLTDVPAAAAHLSVISLQCWALRFDVQI